MQAPLLQRSRRRRSSGVSLVEALVALAVMGFGMLGVVAMQASMRMNSDVAKQRSEAVRLAQELLEQSRSVTSLTVVAGRLSWTEVVSQPEHDVAGINATYKRTLTVSDLGAGPTKNLVADVRWKDRTDTWQSVRMATSMTAVLPDLPASLGIAPLGSSVNRQVSNRHFGIPPGAVNQGDGTSRFTPPGSSSYWVFNNATGLIEKTCTSGGSCSTTYAQLAAGFVLFATGVSAPGPLDAESPSASAISLDVEFETTFPSNTSDDCFKEVESQYIAYYCAIPVNPLSGSKWSGRIYLDGGSLNLASSLSSTNPSRNKVCRYTPVRGCHPVVDSVIWGAPGATASCSGTSPTPQRKMANSDHPLDYANVGEPLVNQNFLVIRAGDGTNAFECPDDNTSTTRVNTNTWHHQPS